MSRAKRRHHRARMFKKARNLLSRWWGNEYVKNHQKDFHKCASGLRDNMQICSCYACGNPRRMSWSGKEKLTMAEKRMLDNYKNNMEEIDVGQITICRIKA